VNYL